MQAGNKIHLGRSPLDLETIRETLLYALSDTKRAPSLSGVTMAIRRAIEEIDAVQERAPAASNRRFRIINFVPRVAAQPRTTDASEPQFVDQSLPSHEEAKQKLPSAKYRKGYGDRSILQQAITDFVKSRRTLGSAPQGQDR